MLDQWKTVETYLTDHLVPKDDVLESALLASNEAGLPAIAVSPNEGKMLHIYAKMTGAKKILELGTLGGYSTIWLARALPEGGKLISLEFDPKHAEVARKNVERAGLSGKVDIRVGAALDLLPKLEAEKAGPFDFFFIDADKENIPHYLTWALKLSRPGSVIVVDNVIRDGRVADESLDDKNIKGVQKLLDMLATENRVVASAVQTVGSKGYDGIAVIRVEG
jgi:predicted O-methyltransferase YrrM